MVLDNHFPQEYEDMGEKPNFSFGDATINTKAKQTMEYSNFREKRVQVGRMAEGGGSNLPPGFHFFPSEEELVCYFLHRKASMIPCHSEIIPTLALHRFDPWDLHCKALRGGNYWYFFTCRTQRRETPSGYWRQDGVEQPVKDVGKKSTLIFHAGDPPNGIRTNWVMHEYCFAGNVASSSSSSAQKTAKKKGRSKATDAGEWVVCRVYEASSGAQLGSKEEGMELSCLDEIYLSFDDYDEVSLPKR